MKTAWIGGGSGFIGHHMARRLKQEGYWVRVVDIKPYEYGDNSFCDEFVLGDLRNQRIMSESLKLYSDKKYSFYPQPFDEAKQFDEVYSFACQMGGAGYVFTGEHDADIMHDSCLINLNLANTLREQNFKGKLFYSSSACMYPKEIQSEIEKPFHYGKRFSLKEEYAYPANPDSEYGWEKLFSERLFLAYQRNHGLNVRIARFHNIYGPEGTYQGGREKAPAAMCRKVVEAHGFKPLYNVTEQSFIEVWGTGHQTRSFLYIDDCIDAVRLLMQSDFTGPVNIGSEEMVTINQLAQMAIEFKRKRYKY